MRIYVLCFIISISSLASEILEVNNLVYEPKSFKQQLIIYKEIYDDLFAKNHNNSYETHEERLFHISKNAFALTRDYINEHDVYHKNTEKQDKTIYLNYLNTLYQSSAEINKQKNFTPLHFERINLLCSLISQIYFIYYYEGVFAGEKLWFGSIVLDKEGQDIKISGLKEALDNGVKDTVEFITTILNKEEYQPSSSSNITFYSLPKSSYKRFYPMAIIYSNKIIPIGYQTFNNHFFNNNYPIFLAEFITIKPPKTYEESLIKKKDLSKKNVHYDTLQSLFTFLIHDFFHRNTAIEWFMIREKTKAMSAKDLEIIFNLNKNNNKETKLIAAALFFIMHESKPFIDYDSSKYPKNKKEALQKLVKRMKEMMIISINYNGRGAMVYMVNNRDNEYMLIYSQKNYVPLIPVTHERNQFLPLASNNLFTVVAIELLEIEGKKIIQAYNLDNDEKYLLACKINENNNLELEYPWQWLKKEDRKKLFDDDINAISDITKKTEALKRNDLNHKRQKYAEKYLIIGIEKFWDDFLQISEKAFEY